MSSAASDLVKNGLPPWVYTWKMVAAIAIMGPLLVMLIGSGVGWVASQFTGPSTHAPDCFTMIYADPLKAGMRKLDRHIEDVAKIRDDHKASAERLHELARTCHPDTCSGAEKTAFRRAAIGYMSGRGWAMQRLFLRYGDEGLRYAGELYDNSYDVALINAVRRAFAAGLLDISRLHSDEAVVRMLLFKPLSELKLCRAA